MILSFNYTQRGFILVTVLFFLAVLGLLVFTLLETVHLELRMAQNYTITSQQFQAAEAGLEFAEMRLGSSLIEKTFYGKLRYVGYPVCYTIQRIGLPLCIGKQQAYYYRITAQTRLNQQQPLILQTTYLKKIDETCQGEENKLIKEGRSSWRELA
jgi:Tfp pilus assembly protein PilX